VRRKTCNQLVGTFQVYPNLLGHLLQRFQALWEQDHVGLVDGRHRDRRSHIPVVIRDGEDFLPLLVFVARVPDAIAPFLATVLVPSPCSTRRSSCLASARCATLATNACQSDPSSAHLALDRHASEVHCWPFLPALLRTGRDTYRIIRLSGLLISSTLAD
jgi:hypothetical protein